MKPQPKSRITSMLTEAYHQLGANNVRELDARAKEAMEYLAADREHYIEVLDADIPECYCTAYGIICKTIPLAREIIRDQESDHVREHTAILLLLISDSGNHYVYSYSWSKQYPNPSQNTYAYPVYHYAELEEIREHLEICPPQEIRPAATALDWETYGMMFTAFAHLDRSDNINNIPHRTERAMLAYTHTPPEELMITGRSYLGKLVPLARGHSTQEQMRDDHRYSCREELCLLIMPEKPYYILKTYHTYSYFRKEIYDTVPGGCTYETTGEKQETTYRFVTLSDIPKDMHPFYY